MALAAMLITSANTCKVGLPMSYVATWNLDYIATPLGASLVAEGEKH